MGLTLGPVSANLTFMKTLEAEKARGNFTKFLSMVLDNQESFQIVKAGVPCAYLVPAAGGKCDSHEFAADLADAGLSAQDRRALAAAVRKGRKTLKPLKNPWG
jgi:hypothetical protein